MVVLASACRKPSRDVMYLYKYLKMFDQPWVSRFPSGGTPWASVVDYFNA